ncbi:Alginate biosynthesis transcriptional regulatory protein AlgB [Nocardioides aquaticus]|uniref:Alginate biosynthesis transcriptional regulatory protein AlgB n=1 Tax=Nocardioides aquaticus TaxID=160826 RepID=A0ABX8EBC8_9ACTN|nr:GAF domain-containing protein [Nocardioides aquaticus]QVT77698.1 Alginate biosynthesis transcriptional regulatory protein AlgB [Nocardioides aquaticus]
MGELEQHAPDRVVASWRRSEDYGVSHGEVQPRFSGAPPTESLFATCGREVLGDLHRSLAAEPVSLMLTDADGLVLDRRSGDHALLRALDAVHLAPGFSYAEREAGTNGLGLALADRTPTVVRSEQHYALSLRGYTCAAVPVLDPRTGRLEGALNLTTWSASHSDLLLALARSAAGTTTALMLARSGGGAAPTPSRGAVYRVEAPRLEPGSGTLTGLSASWTDALTQVRAAVASGRVVAVVGERGAGRTTLLAQAARAERPRGRVLAARVPAPDDVATWLDLWSPEVGKEHTTVLLGDADLLPAWAADRLRDLLPGAGPAGWGATAGRLEDLPAALVPLVGAVVQVPPLRERPDDVVPLARHLAHQVRGREVDLTPAAEQALRDHGWPGNVAELRDVVRDAATRTDVVDVRHLPAEVLSQGTHRLSRIETFERDEIVRVLTRPGVTMREGALELGMSRATVYRKIGQYGIRLPRG